MNNGNTPSIISDIADAVGGTITECVNDLGDGSGFATMSLPLPEDHWLYVTDEDGFTPRPHYPMRAGGGSRSRDYLARLITQHGGQYGVKCATSNGRLEDFDPDALVRNIEIGLFGVFTGDGLHGSDGHLFDPIDTSPTLGAVLLEAVALAIHDGLLTPEQVEGATTAIAVAEARERDLERAAQRERDYLELCKRKGWEPAPSIEGFHELTLNDDYVEPTAPADVPEEKDHE